MFVVVVCRNWVRVLGWNMEQVLVRTVVGREGREVSDVYLAWVECNSVAIDSELSIQRQSRVCRQP
jgi:hypothetical protein